MPNEDEEPEEDGIWDDSMYASEEDIDVEDSDVVNKGHQNKAAASGMQFIT